MPVSGKEHCKKAAVGELPGHYYNLLQDKRIRSLVGGLPTPACSLFEHSHTTLKQTQTVRPDFKAISQLFSDNTAGQAEQQWQRKLDCHAPGPGGHIKLPAPATFRRLPANKQPMAGKTGL